MFQSHLPGWEKMASNYKTCRLGQICHQKVLMESVVFTEIRMFTIRIIVNQILLR